MDIKMAGVQTTVMREALAQARAGRLHILEKMEATISSPRESISTHAPRIVTITIPVDKIRDVIGPGGSLEFGPELPGRAGDEHGPPVGRVAHTEPRRWPLYWLATIGCHQSSLSRYHCTVCRSPSSNPSDGNHPSSASALDESTA